MKNITLSVDDATYRRARVVAARRGTSVSALVRDYLRSLQDDNGRPAAHWNAFWSEFDAEAAEVGERPSRERTYDR